MAFNFSDENNNVFYTIEKSEIEIAEKEMKIIIPKELKEFYLNIGYSSLTEILSNIMD